MKYFRNRWVIVVALGALSALDAALLVQNARLKHTISAGSFSLAPPVGRRVPPLSGIDQFGHKLQVAYNSGQRATFVFVLTRGCAICDSTWRDWRPLIASSDPSKVKPVFLIPAGAAPDYLQALGHNGEAVLTELDPKDTIALNLRLAPEVLEITPAGVISAAWPGQPSPKQRASLRTAMLIR